jgi:ELWxxDGT repeat protein
MTVAAVTLAGMGASAGTTARTEGAEAVDVDARNAGIPLLACDPRTPPSDPRDLVDVGGTLFFTAGDGIHGRDVWKSDGTAAGTVLVKDIKTGGRLGHPSDLVDVGGTLFFAARSGGHGRELWKSDGTRAGTVLVKEINPGGDSYTIGGLVDVGGRCASPPTTEPTATSCGSPTAPRRARSWSRT